MGSRRRRDPCPERRRVTVHILEDDPGVSDSLDMLLRGMGHRTVAHPDAESFFAADIPGPEDVVVVDLMLPGISGARVIRWLSRLKEPPRVVAISGQPRAAIEAQLRGLEHLPVLRKPLSPELVSMIV
jgi:FixJ family two-component response regulator